MELSDTPLNAKLEDVSDYHLTSFPASSLETPKADTQDDLPASSHGEKQSASEPTWDMFEKIKELGVGSFGVVYLVKCIQGTVVIRQSAPT